MVKGMAEALMDAEVDALCGAAHGERHPERTNRRNGYRERAWDTRTGTIELAVPKLRAGSYFPFAHIASVDSALDHWRCLIIAPFSAESVSRAYMLR